jgi:HD superfamily phosphohydrolase
LRLLEARYYFSERVYYHHAKVAAGALLARAVETALAAGAVREQDFWLQDDASVLAMLERSMSGGAKGGKEPRERVRALVERLRQRRLYKRACVYPRYENAGAQEGLIERFFAAAGRARAPRPRRASPTWCASRPAARST